MLLVSIALSAMSPEVLAEVVDTSDVYRSGALEAVNAIIASRSDLKRWVLHADCSRKHRKSEETETSSLFAAFDETTERFRFETRGEFRIGLGSASHALTESTAEHRANHRAQIANHPSLSLVVRNHDYMIEWFGIGTPVKEAGESATCHKELRDPGTLPKYTCSMAFNPRAAGLIDGTCRNMHASIETMLLGFSENAKSVTKAISPSGQIQIVYAYPKSVQRKIYVNPNQGFTVSRSVVSVLDEAQNEKDVPRYEAIADWKFDNGTWIPTQFSWIRFEADGSVAEAKFNISWDFVNPERIDDDVFDYRTFKDFWPGLNLVDRRGGKLVVLEAPNIGDYVVGNGGVAEEVQAIPLEGVGSRQKWTVGLNVLLILLLIGAILARQWRK